MSLELTGVGYRYAGASGAALLDVDLRLGPGEVVGVAGASESGKTTLCLVAAGLAPRTVGGQIRGTILLDGEDVDAWPMHRLSARIGIGFQNPATQLSQVAGTVFEEVAFGPMNLGVPRDEVVSHTWAALETLRIDGLAERDPLRLSGGQQQLVAMAGLLAMRPEHLVLDEPTAQLDPEGTRLVGDAIARLASEGRQHPHHRAEDGPAGGDRRACRRARRRPDRAPGRRGRRAGRPGPRRARSGPARAASAATGSEGMPGLAPRHLESLDG